MTKLFTWLTGVSAVLALIYYVSHNPQIERMRNYMMVSAIPISPNCAHSARKILLEAASHRTNFKASRIFGSSKGDTNRDIRRPPQTPTCARRAQVQRYAQFRRFEWK